jgi:hypothetical protein
MHMLHLIVNMGRTAGRGVPQLHLQHPMWGAWDTIQPLA